ncbi:xanthine dehydrogenase family protein molybdopterin-binding subunit [Nonomuraea turkmeniaca]|uniref:Xanthine dehydrogenase family protein molybdopterin-binding subunit n=1 Tax=Nonomuraea turkmeniaca TaxID=103838 RepID=A0A5S4FTG7_9ACTN|nr:xanthine dehydrogenase family protein molybdopterin-binding subunit [Nonomuraea turkmeniaca]TMR24046.1 xanthine dehydrogenase family protein molybdopterin-binding subunit [Nonomuraea turkmeniaca]
MTILERPRHVGPGVDRVDGPQKVTGAARYPNDFSHPDMAHAALVRATIAAGRVARLDTGAAESAPGVLAVLTHLNAPRLATGPSALLATPPPPLRDDRILYYGQYVAVVVADTPERASAAARRIEVGYEPAEPLLDIHDPRAERLPDPWGSDASWGDTRAALDDAHVVIEASYTTAENTNNPLGLFSTLAEWDGDTLTVHDSTQWPTRVRATLAQMFGVPEAGVRVLVLYVGGGFGAGLRVWPHVILTAMAARQTGRPVKLVMTRPEMFTGIGHRPATVQHIRIGATRDGRLTAIEHESRSTVAIEGDNIEPCATVSTAAYACPNVTAHDEQVRLNIPWTNSMRAPGEAQGNFVLESAIDELSHALGIDPLELRLRNYAEVHPRSGLPWSSKALRECYEVGAERFGWSRRVPEPGSMREGDWLVGYGMAGISYFWYQAPCQARATVRGDGTAYVRSAVTDIGTGTYTIMTQLAAELLGLEQDRVTFGLGDTSMPPGPQAGGSGLTAALGSAVHAACRNLVRAFLDAAAADPASPLAGCDLDDVAVTGGRVHRVGEPERGESYAGILAMRGLDELSADGDSTPRTPQEAGMAPAGPFGARFVEVRVDPELGRLSVARVVSAIDGGRILNEKLARSQIIGGTVGGIGMAMFEDTVSDPGTGRIANATLGDYLVPVNADIPDMDVSFVGGPDAFNPIGVKGVGEIGLVGMAAAIANAVFHATGKRIRSVPITIDRLLL